MGIIGIGRETHLYLGGLKVNKEIQLMENSSLLPLNSSLNIDTVAKVVKSDIDFGIVLVFASSITSSLKVVANTPKELAVDSWNSLWDLILLSAIFNTEISFNLQSNHSVEEFNETSMLNITNYHLRSCVHRISNENMVS